VYDSLHYEDSAQVGAFRVIGRGGGGGGMDDRSITIGDDHDHDLEANHVPNRPRSTRQDEYQDQPVALLEATLVEPPEHSTEQQSRCFPFPLVQAEPMCHQYQYQQLEQGGSSSAALGRNTNTTLIDTNTANASRNSERRNDAPKISCCAKVTIVVLCVLLVCGVGVTAAFFFGGRQPKQRSAPSSVSGVDEYKNETAEEQHVVLEPFTDQLQKESIREIEMDPTSPQALANQWISQDPHLSDLPLYRQLQRFALATIFFATNGHQSKWTHDEHWLDYDVHECDWYSSHHPEPVCDADSKFLVLNLKWNGLEQQIDTADFYYLKDLRILDVSYNNLGGVNPPGVSTSIEVMDFSYNRMHGRPLVEAGWVATKLRTLRFNDNLLTGDLPVTVVLIMPNLVYFDGSRIFFTGVIPDIDLGPLAVSLLTWKTSDNLLSGTLPSHMRFFRNLQVLDWSNNVDVVGTIPVGWEQMTNLQYLSLAGTGITGTVPKGLCFETEPPTTTGLASEVEGQEEATMTSSFLHMDLNCDTIQCCHE